MCITCDFQLPLMRVNAAYRLRAATADAAMAQFVLEHLGFKGLRLKSNSEGVIRYSYQSYDERRLNHMMGLPKSDIKAPNIRYPYGVHGLLAVWPGKSEVLLRNTVKQGKTFIEIPDVLKKEAPPDMAPLPKAGTENDDAGVPVTHIPGNLEADYLRAQQKPKYRVKFMQDIWIYFNHTKFGNKLKHPSLVLMKGIDAAKMKTRGIWYPSLYELRINPNIFNASQNFFMEIFLHEMCHQKVTDLRLAGELTKEEIADNAKHKGHGTVWATWMKKVGLDARRFDPNENSTYMDEDKKSEHDIQMDQWKKSKDAADEMGLSLVTVLKAGDPVIVRRMEGLRAGYAVYQVKKTDNEWAVLPSDTARGLNKESSFNWWVNRANTIYRNTEPSVRSLAGDPTFERYMYAIVRNYEAKKEERRAKSTEGFRPGDQVVVERTYGRYEGVLVKQVKMLKNVWTVLPKDQLSEPFYEGEGFEWWVVEGAKIFISSQRPNLEHDPQFRRYAEEIDRQYKQGRS